MTKKLDQLVTELPADLVGAWMAIHQPNTAEGMARQLGAWFGRSYDGNKLLRWARGAESLPAPVAALMRRDVLTFLLGNVGAKVATRMEQKR